MMSRATGLLVVLLVASLLALGGCVSRPDLSAVPQPGTSVLAAFGDDPAVTTASDWTARRAPLLRKAFQDQVYGPLPALGVAVVEQRQVLQVEDVGKAIIEQWRIRLGEGEAARRYHLILALPGRTTGPAPLVILELFCGNRAALPGRPESVVENRDILPSPCRNPAVDPLARLIFGRRINGPPIAEMTDKGYALAFFYPGEVAPDDPELGPAALAGLQPGVAPERRGGALAIWSQLFGKSLDVLAADARLDPSRVAIWGHSRHGKAALLAAAFDRRFAAVISHQSGRGGASLTRSPAGESVKQITDAYGYWFGSAFAKQAIVPSRDLDQHQLIALIAPRPVLLGNGLGDSWSDPAGAFRAAEAATPVYRLFGSPGLTVQSMEDFDPEADLSFYSRDGGHGVRTEDWLAFERFLDHALARS
jgi:hypothetical protein